MTVRIHEALIMVMPIPATVQPVPIALIMPMLILHQPLVQEELVTGRHYRLYVSMSSVSVAFFLTNASSAAVAINITTAAAMSSASGMSKGV